MDKVVDNVVVSQLMATIDEIKIEKDVPLPVIGSAGKWATLRALLIQMEVGDSFFVKAELLPKSASAGVFLGGYLQARRTASLAGRKFISRSIHAEGTIVVNGKLDRPVLGIRIWRTK